MCLISIKGNLQRARFEAAGRVKCTVVFTCIKHTASSTEQNINPSPTSKTSQESLKAFEPNAFTESNGTACIGRSTATEMNRHPEIEFVSCQAHVCGSCVIDKSRIRFDITDTNTSDGAKDDGKGSGSLFGWLFSSTKAVPESHNTTQISGGSVIVPAISTVGTNEEVFNFFTLGISDLLSSSVADLPLINRGAKGATLKQHESITSIFSLDLPPGIPPTFRGYCVRYAYAIIISCTYLNLRDGSTHSTTLKIPFRVTNLAATLVCLPIPRIPISHNFNFVQVIIHGDIRSDSLSIPSILAPPLSSDVLVKNGSDSIEGHRSASSSNKAVVELFSRKMEQPVQFGVYSPEVACTVGIDDPLYSIQRKHCRIGYSIDTRVSSSVYDSQSQLPFAVRGVLLADTFSLSNSIRGVIFCSNPLGQNGHTNALACFRYSIIVECVEYTPKELLREGSELNNSCLSDCNRDDGNRLCVVHCGTIEEREVYFSLNARQVPFQIPLNKMTYQQTLYTSLVEYRWQIRFKFFFAKAIDVLVATSQSEETTFPDIDQTREVVIPIILTHPVGTEEHTLGLTHVVL
eukprot:Tbor_TRINITY_DN6193_c3_g1::TRINITY_DN6193_c3_g1_i2::g.21825::m.21825